MNSQVITLSFKNGGKGSVKLVCPQNHLGGTDEVGNSYGFTGELKSSTRIHTAHGQTTTIADTYTYDHMGRRLESGQRINGAAATVLSQNTYNELGQLKGKSLHNGLQTTNYTYNERGWLKSGVSPQFSLELRYQDAINGATPQYNGNIANQLWGDGNLINAFSYSYDKQNRLLSGTSTEIAMSEVLTYDLMGNISTLARDGSAPGVYSYTGNRLNQVSGGITTGLYGYDDNGNAIIDGRSGVTMTYNLLNLPATVAKAGLGLVYTYDALGEKLTKVSNGVTRDYVSGIEYNGNAIDIIRTEAGIARKNGGTYSYEYNLTDHLGNVRHTIYRNPVSGAIETIQKDDYYPFGQRKIASGGTNRYLYNGKELQEELGQYDYGARFYDPVIGRWNVIDPLAEAYTSSTPYNYVDNNPILRIDPNGMDWSSTHTDMFGNVLAIYDDDDDLSVYKHEDAKTKEDVDSKRKEFGTGLASGVATFDCRPF